MICFCGCGDSARQRKWSVNTNDYAKETSMGIEDLAKQATDMAAGAVNKAKETLASEEQTDALLDKAADAASKLTGHKFDDKIDQARDFADKKLGSE